MNTLGLKIQTVTQYLYLTVLILSFYGGYAQPAGFVNEKVADTYGAISFNFLPDGRILLLEKDGTILIGDPTMPKPITMNTYMQVPNVNDEYEAGLLNITLDPDFESNNFFYVMYSHIAEKKRRVSRFTHEEKGGGLSSTGDPGSELVLWQDTEPVYTNGHLGGAMGFGNDGKLYFAVGDGFKTDGTSQKPETSFGKVHRINSDGSIPGDNPFFDNTSGMFNSSGVLKSIYAFGLRNPFKGSVDPVSNRMFIGEVGGNFGQAHEDLHRVDLGTSGNADLGTNYGWPNCGESGRNGDGSCSNPAYEDPVFTYETYPNGGVIGNGASITAGTVYRGNVYPSQYQGAFFFGDYVRSFIKYLTLDGAGNVTGEYTFQNNAGKAVDVRQGPDGMIYYLEAFPNSSLAGGELHRYLYNAANQPPLCVDVDVDPTEINPGETVSFKATANDPNGDPMTYEWNFGDGSTQSGNVPGNGQLPPIFHQYPNAGSYTAQLQLSDGNFNVFCDPITITVGSPPEATILKPNPAYLFRADDALEFEGDVQGGTPPYSYSWTVELWHDEHTHPTNVTNFAGAQGIFIVPHDDHSYAGNVGFRFYLTVTDGNGLKDTEVVSLDPEKIDITVNTNQPGNGLKVSFDGVPLETPTIIDQMIGYHQVLEAPLTQCIDGVSYTFTGWSDGETSNQRTYITPENDVTLVANYSQGSSLPTGWFNEDIGFVAAAGNLCFDSQGTFSVSGSGEGIQGVDDEFHFVYRSCAGDAEIVARVLDVEATDDWARSGVMIRESLDDQSPSTFLALNSQGDMSWHSRTTQGDGASWNQTGNTAAPHWLRITRTDDDFAYAHSTNGISWTNIGTVTIDMGEDSYIGLAHTSQEDGILGTGQFANVSYTCVDNNGGVFPVELLSFTGKEMEESIALNWETSMELNNNYFTLEKSLDGTTFEHVARVSSQGNSNSLQRYQAIDENPIPGRNIYRLRQTDLDGSTKKLEIIEVYYNQLSPQYVRAYPNPIRSGETLNVEIDVLSRGTVSFQIVNLLGQVMKQKEVRLASGRHQVSLDTQDLEEAYYTLIIQDGSAKRIRKLVVKK